MLGELHQQSPESLTQLEPDLTYAFQTKYGRARLLQVRGDGTCVIQLPWGLAYIQNDDIGKNVPLKSPIFTKQVIEHVYLLALKAASERAGEAADEEDRKVFYFIIFLIIF